MGVTKNGKDYTYTIGNQSWTQSNLNNNMSGTDANAIYYATHGGNAGGMLNDSGRRRATRDDRPSKVGSGGSGSYSGGSGSGTGEYSYSGGGGYDYAAMIEGMLAQQRAAAQAAYDASRARLDEAWGNTRNALSDNLGLALANLKQQYDYGSGVARKDAANSLREAYINYMMNKKNLGQNLSAMGVSGGATESSLAKMYNNYGSSRNDINNVLADNIAELLNNYQNNVASANQAYNSQFADANMNYVNNLNALEQALANNVMGSYSGSSLTSLANYAQTLAGLQDAMAQQANTYTPTQNTLAENKISTTQGTDSGSVTDYARLKAMADDMSAKGASATSLIQTLKDRGASLDMIYDLLGV